MDSDQEVYVLGKIQVFVLSKLENSYFLYGGNTSFLFEQQNISLKNSVICTVLEAYAFILLISVLLVESND